MKKKMENIQKNKWSYLEISFFSSVSWTSQQLYAPLFSASCSSSSYTLSLKTPRKLLRSSDLPLLLFFENLLPFPSSFSSSLLCISDLPFQWSLLQPPFLPHSFCSHLFCPRDPPPESSSTCQSLTAASKSEVDSLWPLRMWHVARWDSDTWLKMWSAKTNREKVTHA